MLIGLLGTAVGVFVAGAIVAWKLRRDSGRRSSDAAAGKPVTLPCALRVDAKWKHGKLTLHDELAEWRPRFGAQEPVAINAAGTVRLDQRDVGAREAIAINPQLTVLALNVQGRRVELAVLPADLPLVGNALRL
jgi:hypothetical protein